MTIPNLDQSHAYIAAAALAFGAFLRPKILAALKALPDYLVMQAKRRFEDDCKSGKISPTIARLAIKIKRAAFEWADEEMPQALGEDKMAKVIDALEKLPYIGRLVAADPEAVRLDLQTEFDAVRAEVKKVDDAAKASPAAPPAPIPQPAP